MKMANIVSIDISIGKDATGELVDDEEESNEAAVTDWSAECSCAE